MSAPPAPTLAIHAARLFDGAALTGPRRVEIAGGRIVAVLEAGHSLEAEETAELPPGAILAPGFIDTQANGGGDILLNDDPSAAAVAGIVAAHRRFGVTGLLPTLITDHPDRLRALAAAAGEAMAVPGVLGFHLEGPHLNLKRKGAHPPGFIRPMLGPDRDRLAAFARRGRSLVTLAPEMVDAADVAHLRALGLRISAGHSDATAEQMRAAADAGVTGVTHLFNAMSQMTARAPGLVGAALADDRLFAGIIADGAHVAPASLRAAFRAMGPDRLMLVTDAMPTVGGKRPEFLLHGRRIALADGRLTDEEGVLTGAHLTMIDAVRNAVGLMGARLSDALRMASATPARFLGLDGERGHVRPGFRADLAAFDGSFAVLRTWIGDQPCAANE